MNHNRLLKSYEGAIGVKTGFTKASGRCLVSSAERDGLRLIAVTLNAPDDWNDHRALLDYGFSKYKSVTLLKSGVFSATIPVVGGKENCVSITNSADAKATVEENENLSYRIELPKFVFGGFDRGDVIGRIVWHREDGTIAGEVPLVVTFGVERQIYRSFWQRILGSLFSF